MELSGRYKIATDRETVWRGLNDPDILREAIPGCQELTQDSPTAFSAKVKLKLGPVGATFSGAVSLEDLNPPVSYRLVGEGKGGVAGFGKGSAVVQLDEADGGAATILTYNGEAQVGGRLAQIGSRLIRGSVRKLAADFFVKFAEALEADAEEMPMDDDEAGA